MTTVNMWLINPNKAIKAYFAPPTHAMMPQGDEM